MAGVGPARTGPDDAVRGVVLRLLALGDRRYRDADHRPSLAVVAGGHLDAVHLCDLRRRCRGDPAQRSSVPDRNLGGDARCGALSLGDRASARRAWCRALPDLVRLHQFSSRLWQLPPAFWHADLLALDRHYDLRRVDRAVHDRANGQWDCQRRRSSGAAGPGARQPAALHRCRSELSDVSAPIILALMSLCFLSFGYLGVPVPFSLLAGVFVGAFLADVSLAAIVQKIFDGVA